MSIGHTTSVKRKHKEEPASSSLQSYGTTAENNKAPFTSKAQLETVDSSTIDSQAYRAVAVLAACRSALVRSPAASRAALEKHRAFIDSELAKALETVGSYDIENSYDTPLHESVRRGDVATTRALIVAGADVNAKNVKGEFDYYEDASDEDENDVVEEQVTYDNEEDEEEEEEAEGAKEEEEEEDEKGVTALELATDDPYNTCRVFLEHHVSILAVLATMPECLVTSAVAYCATLSASKFLESMPNPVLSLLAYHFDPSFLWVPSEARALIMTWARDAFIVQMATISQFFSDLPDDCTGDVLEYLKMSMPRRDSLLIATHCSSPEAHAWVRAVVTVAVAEEALSLINAYAEQGDVAGMKACLNKGANFDDQCENGDTAMNEASIFGHTGVVRLLLQAGANPNLRAVDGDTSLTIVTAFGDMGGNTHGHITTVKLLLEAGADKDVQKENGETPLFNALERNHSAVVELLLQAGANLEIKDKNGATALVRASVNSVHALIERLLEAGANIEAKDKNGSNALMKAATRGEVGIVKLLLEWGADKDAKNNDGSTALMAAACDDRRDIVKALLDVGADKDAENEVGKTAFQIATENGHRKVVCLLRR